MAVLKAKGAQALTMQDGLLFAELNNIPVHWTSPRQVSITVGAGTYTLIGSGFGRVDETGFPQTGRITQIRYETPLGSATLKNFDIAAPDFSRLMETPPALNALLFAGADKLSGGGATDWLRGEGGDDVLRGKGGDDFLEGGAGNDKLYGGDAKDYLAGGVGDDRLYGDAGDDALEAHEGDDWLDGGAGNDLMHGGTGDDTYVVDSAGDIVTEEIGGGGHDRVIGGVSYALTVNIEDLTLTGSADITGIGNGLGNAMTNEGTGWVVLNGGGGNDTLNAGTQVGYHDRANEAYGGDGDDVIRGGGSQLNAWGDAGNDTLIGSSAGDYLHGGDGNDTVSGGAGNDYITGGLGADVLSGGAGADRLLGGLSADRFVFETGSLGPIFATDTVMDFNAAQGDIIDLRAIDADVTTAGDQAFHLVDAFSGHAGELMVSQFTGYANVHFDIDGDGRADFALRVDGVLYDATGWWL